MLFNICTEKSFDRVLIDATSEGLCHRFSRANLMYMRAFALGWPDEQIVQQPVGQLPWGHNLVLLSQLKDPAQRLAYAESANADNES